MGDASPCDVGHVGVIEGIGGETAQVFHDEIEVAQALHELLLQVETAVVGPQRDFHGVRDHPSNRDRISVQLVPPKPNELFMA